MPKPNPVWIFRITHIANLPHVLEHGIVTASAPNRNPSFVQIGDPEMIQYRKGLSAPYPPGGVFSEYIPFLFGPRSPMLYRIATGYDGIQKFPQEDIVYLISSVEKLMECDVRFFFSNGHARTDYSEKFTKVEDLDKLDWDAIYSADWRNDSEHPGRKDRKQSELMAKDWVPKECLLKIGVYNERASDRVRLYLQHAGMEHLEIHLSPKKLYYDHL